MASSQQPVTERVERFAPTTGRFTGVAGLVVCASIVGYVVMALHTVTGVRLGLAAAFVGVAVWVTLLRPRAKAYGDTLVLVNSLRDTHVPLRLIDEVSVRHTLNVWVGDKRYVCIGIGRSTRKLVKGHKRGSAGVIGMGRLEDYTERAENASVRKKTVHYEEFVVERIKDLMAKARDQPAGGSATVRRALARPEAGMLLLLATAFTASFLL